MLHSDLLHGDEKSIWFCFSSSEGPPTLTIEGETPGAGGDERQPFESLSVVGARSLAASVTFKHRQCQHNLNGSGGTQIT